jgi:hypothetical protein
MFPLYDPRDTEAANKPMEDLSKMQGWHVDRKGRPTDLLGDLIMNALGFGLTKLHTAARSAGKTTAVLTRYATSLDHNEVPQIVVDVVEMRSKSGGGSFRVKASRDAGMVIRDKFRIRLKKNKMWAKDMNKKYVESVKVCEETGGKMGREVELTMVQRLEREVVVDEFVSVWKRFEKEWEVPVPIV